MTPDDMGHEIESAGAKAGAGIVYGCITPHGFEIIPDIAGPELEKFEGTRAGMQVLGQRMQSYAPDTIVIATPHGFKVDGAITIATTSYTSGRLTKFGGAAELSLTCDREFALKLLGEARAAEIPVRNGTFGSASGYWSVLPLDWASLIPMWFLGGKSERPPEVVIVTTTRDIGFDELMKMGRVIAKVAANSSKRVGFVASADQGHCHLPEPNGFHPASAEFDDLVCQAVQRDDLSSLFTLDETFVANARPDSLWQLAVLQGVRSEVRMHGELISYQVPTYYGMMCASYEVVRS